MSDALKRALQQTTVVLSGLREFGIWFHRKWKETAPLSEIERERDRIRARTSVKIAEVEAEKQPAVRRAELDATLAVYRQAAENVNNTQSVTMRITQELKKLDLEEARELVGLEEDSPLRLKIQDVYEAKRRAVMRGEF